MRGKDIVPPIHRSAVFQFESLPDLTAAIAEGDYVYSRWANPTVRAVEETVMELEEAEDALAFSSGMAAIATLLLTTLRKGDRLIVLRDVYGGTFEFIRDLLPRWGIEPIWIGLQDGQNLTRLLQKEHRLVYIESPTNPLLRVFPIEETANASHGAGALLVVDNTFATPVNQRPIALGADVVVHSASKFLGGHNDLIGGFAAGKKDFMNEMSKMRTLLGGVMDPHAAFLCWRGLKTLTLRLRTQSNNAAGIARHLDSRPYVRRVWYPGLQSHPDFELARRQMSGFGAVVTFELDTDVQGVQRFLKSLRTIKVAPSLGGCDSLITHPASTSHVGLSRSERELMGIGDGLVRLSTGLEDLQILIGDLDGGLKCIENLSGK